MKYILKYKNIDVAALILDDSGIITKFSVSDDYKEYAPLDYKYDSRWLKLWWNERATPFSQGRISEMLRGKGLISSEEYLMKNLGLSLTDYYWICPIDLNLTWEDVSLFSNDFKDNILEKTTSSINEDFSAFSPNSSLKGELEKSWMIKKGNRILVKGNHTELSSESINELLATLLHQKQEYDNYTEYKSIKIKEKKYDFGCYSKAFTSENDELISAWALITSEKKGNSISLYEHLINVAVKHGISETQLRSDLEYQILSDFVLSNRDRHMNNIGFIRDPKTLKLKRMAPIFDTGKSMFVGLEIPDEKSLIDLDTNSFVNSEYKLLNYVNNFGIINLNNLPTPEDVHRLYTFDSKINKSRVEKICHAYELKVKLLNSICSSGEVYKLK